METAYREDRSGASPQPLLSEKQFRRLREFIEGQCGIHLAEEKQSLLEGRIRRRLRVVGLDRFEDYSRYLFSPEGMDGRVMPHDNPTLAAADVDSNNESRKRYP